MPPVAAPAAAPTAVDASHTAATTGPSPGIASRPSPASNPAPPPSAAPMPAPLVASETSSTSAWSALTYLFATRLTLLEGIPAASRARTASRAWAYESKTRVTTFIGFSYGNLSRVGDDVALVVDGHLDGL